MAVSMRHMFGWLACLALLMATSVRVQAQERARQDGGSEILLKGSGYVVDGAAGAYAGKTSAHLARMMRSWSPLDENMARIKDAAAVAEKSSAIQEHLEERAKQLGYAKLLWHASQGEWKKVAEDAVEKLIDIAQHQLFKWLGRDLIAEAAGVLSTILCTAIGFSTLGVGFVVCEMIAGAISYMLVDAAKSYAAEQAVDLVRSRRCRWFSELARCEETPPRGETGRSGGDAPVVIPVVPRGAGAPAPSGTGSRSSGPSISVGPVTLHSTAENVTTIATNGGHASTNIGTMTSGGHADVSARDVTTIANGKTAETNIGGASGSVHVEGTIVNEGGILGVGAGNVFSRNGQTCIELFRQTCIVSFYVRRHSDPCAPGYWMDGMRCLLPSDLQHTIRP